MSATTGRTRNGRWILGWALSLALHGTLAGIVFLMPAQARRLPTRPIEVIERKLPEPPKVKPPEPKDEPKPEPKEAPAEAKVAMTKRIPKAPPKAEPEPEPKAEPKGPPPDDTGTKTFGIKMEGTTKAAPGTGVAIPRGDSLRVSPTITKKGPEKKQDKPCPNAPVPDAMRRQESAFKQRASRDLMSPLRGHR